MFGSEFHGAQVYAFSKRALESGASSVAVTQIDTHGMDNGNSGFTLAPSTSPKAGEQGENGVEYFLSSNAADEAHGNTFSKGPRTSTQILVWTLSNTRSLRRSNPDIDLRHSDLHVDRYSTPDPSAQKVGSTPLRECINNTDCNSFLFNCATPCPNPFAPEPEYALDSSDTRMMPPTLAAGKLWGDHHPRPKGQAGTGRAQVQARVERQITDYAEHPDQTPPADIANMHRVICCYPDPEALMSAARAHARDRVAITNPGEARGGRAVLLGRNLWLAPPPVP